MSVESAKWMWALGELGFDVRRVAGRIEGEEQDGDVVMPGLAADTAEPPPIERAGVAEALAGADLVVVENLCSLPLNLAAARAVAGAAAEHPGRVLLHHHDLAWQRRHLAQHEREFPPRAKGALHVTVNLRSRRELQARGFEGATAICNRFDFDAPPGDRVAARNALGFGDDDVVVFHPARAIERKNVPGGVRFAAALAAALPGRTVRYWLSGPAEDGYGPTLERVLERSTVGVTLGRASVAADAYAAADVVAFPSTWEGFGNPTIESIIARRPLAVFAYPVLAEIVAHGIRFFDLDEIAEISRALHTSDDARLDANLRRARAAFSLADLPAAIDQAFETRGWKSW